METSLETFQLKCLRCQHVWLRRTMERPKMCPRCHSLIWDLPYDATGKRPKKAEK